MSWIKALTRRKCLSKEEITETRLERVLSVFDLTALGIGSTLGVGIYVIAGQVSKDVAGPAVVLSFILAAIVSILSGLCFAELSARVPKAGSAYIFAYICIGELVAFIIGWSLILEYGIGAASVAKGISLYIDSLVSHSIRETFLNIAPMNVEFLSAYVDFFAFLLCFFLSVALAGGVRLSTMINNLLTSCNIVVVLFFLFCGVFLADLKNWAIPKSDVPKELNAGEGGFLPFGLSGVISGAAICFYGFVGFDCVATTGEEVRNPQRAIPIAIILSLTIVLLAYIGVSSTLTLMFPYYLQDPDAPIPFALEIVGWHVAKWVIGAGALFGLFASLFGGLFPLPRIIYAMAMDGLIFKQLNAVHPRYKTPALATLISGLTTGMLAAFFNLQQLVGLNAICTLLTYTIVSVCVVILRYREDDTSESSCLLPTKYTFTFRTYLKYFINQKMDYPNTFTSKIVILNMLIFCGLSLVLNAILVFCLDALNNGDLTVLIITGIFAFLLIVLIFSIASQPLKTENLPFKMPFVPYIPCISIFINIHLMVVLDGFTWIRFSITLVLGFVIYVFYGIQNSLERYKSTSN